MGDPYASLASSTSTAIESASKHNLQCKVSTDHILMWIQDDTVSGESATTIIKKDMMNYCMHKNDLVVGVRNGWHPSSHIASKAYPAVVVTTANMCLAAQYWLMRLYNNSKNMQDVRRYVHESLRHRGQGLGNHHHEHAHELTTHEKNQIEFMPQFYFMGVSLGLAYAHPDSGDTVGTVMYGGLRTVMNGPCKVRFFAVSLLKSLSTP